MLVLNDHKNIAAIKHNGTLDLVQLHNVAKKKQSTLIHNTDSSFGSSSLNCVVLENIHTPIEGFFGLNPPPPWNFQFSFILSFKNFGF